MLETGMWFTGAQPSNLSTQAYRQMGYQQRGRHSLWLLCFCCAMTEFLHMKQDYTTKLYFNLALNKSKSTTEQTLVYETLE